MNKTTIFKQNQYNTRLYLAVVSTGETDRETNNLALVLPQTVTPPGTEISFKDALTEVDLSASFVFSGFGIAPTSVEQATTFVEAIGTMIGDLSLTRAIFWLTDNTEITKDTVAAMSIDAAGSKVDKSAVFPIVSSFLSLQIEQGFTISLNEDETALELTGSKDITIAFTGARSPVTSQVTKATLSFGSVLTGCIQFEMGIEQQSLYEKLHWGFQFLFPNASDNNSLCQEWLPMANSGVASVQTKSTDATTSNSVNMIEFFVSINPGDLFNAITESCSDSETNCSIRKAYQTRRSFFNFMGSDGTTQPLDSFYCDAWGNSLQIQPFPGKAATDNNLPARLVFTQGDPNSNNPFQLAPEGDFALVIPEGKTTGTLLCGLQGVEYFQYSKDAYIRFLSRQPAYAATYPLSTTSPVESPMTQNQPLLNPTYRTSWAVLISTSQKDQRINYISQAENFYLYGQKGPIHQKHPSLLGHIKLGDAMPVTLELNFPLVPYGGVTPGTTDTGFSSQQIEGFERQIIGANRSKIITQAQNLQPILKATTDTYNVVTQNGTLVTLSTTAGQIWQKILLGRITSKDTVTEFSFNDPHYKVVQAFQTNNLFLVIANTQYLGTFNSKMSLDDWQLEANVGNSNYNDYKNIIIIKGCRGKLFDPKGPTGENLVATTENWTMKDDFAAPTTTQQSTPDVNQIAVLSQWMQDYFQEASQQNDSYFQAFNTIATDENWMGILILRMDINNKPSQLDNILAGMKESDGLHAHHLGISMSQIDNQPDSLDLKDSSSMFGLIYYTDPDVNPIQVEAVAPSNSNLYDFRLLILKAFFQNNQVENFECYAQVTLNQLFGSYIASMGEHGNFYNSIVLKGNLQHSNGQASYSFDNTDDNLFYPDSNIINKFEITDISLVPDPPAQQDTSSIRSHFSMKGFIDFKMIQQTVDSTTETFDLFSFGSPAGEDQPSQGLKFENLTLSMAYTTEAGKAPVTTFDFNTANLSFNPSQSTARPQSLVASFGMELQQLIYKEQGDPSQQGYLPVMPDFQLAGVSGVPWYGLRFNLDLGSPGALAGKAGFNSDMLLAWSPQSRQDSYQATVGISLPGAGGGTKLISLQNVLKLSFGNIRMAFVKDKGFVLMLTDIALKFLGLLKIPPNGSTLFYLFGNPNLKANTGASGLGWYAMYKQKDQKKNSLTLI